MRSRSQPDARRWGPARRRGGAPAELALLLPLLLPLTTIAVDFCRVFFAYTTITGAAHNGALWLSDPLAPSQSRFASFQDAVLADASNLNPAIPTSNITSSSGTDGGGNATVTVTVQYQFNLVTSFLGVSSVNLSRQVTMRKLQIVPN